MIRLFDDWIIDATTKSYLLGKTYKRLEKVKDSEDLVLVERIKIHGYYPYIHQALYALVNLMIKNHVMNHELELRDAIKDIEKILDDTRVIFEPFRKAEMLEERE